MKKSDFIENATAEKMELLKEMQVLLDLAKYPAINETNTINTQDETDQVIAYIDNKIDELQRLRKLLVKLSSAQEDLEADLDQYEWDEENEAV